MLLNKHSISIIALPLIVAIGIGIRLIAAPSQGNPGDIAIAQSWMHSAVVLGIPASYDRQLDHTDLPNHGPVALVLYALTGKAYQWLISPAYEIIQPFHRTFAKLPSIFAGDLPLILLLYVVFRKTRSRRAGLVAASIFAFHPAAIYNSACWGQTDAILSVLIVASFWFLSSENIVPASIALMAALLQKPQALIFVPIFLFLLPRRARVYLSFAATSALTFLIATLPFILHHNLSSALRGIIYAFTSSMPLSAYAFNFWWALFGNGAATMGAADPLLGPLTFKTAGLVALVFAFGAILFAMKYFPQKEGHSRIETWLMYGSFLTYTAFLFSAGMHDRYLFPFIVLGLPFVFRGITGITLYSVASLGTLLNMFDTFPPSFLNHLLFRNETVGVAVAIVLVLLFFSLAVPLTFAQDTGASPPPLPPSAKRPDQPPLLPGASAELLPQNPQEQTKFSRFHPSVRIACFLAALAVILMSFRGALPSPLNIGANVFDFRRQLIGEDQGDSYEYFGFMFITRSNLLQGKHPFADTDLYRYPYGFHYSFGFDGALAVLTGALLGMVMSPLTAYNLTVFIIALTNVFLSRFFFRRIGRLFSTSSEELLSLKSTVAGLIFGLSPYVVARLNGHLNLAFVAGFAALAWAMAQFYWSIKTQRIEKPSLLTSFPLALLLIAIGSLQYLFFAFFALLPFLLLLAVHHSSVIACVRKMWASKRFVVHAMGATLLCALIFLWLYKGQTGALLSHSIRMLPQSEIIKWMSKPYLIDLFLPNGYFGERLALLNPSPPSVEAVVFLGIAALSVLTYSILFDRRYRIASLTAIVYISALTFFGTSVGIQYLVKEAGRFMLLLPLLAGALYMVSPKFGIRTSLLLLTVLLLERSILPLYVAAPPPLDVTSMISRLPGKAVLMVPHYEYGVHHAYPNFLQPFFRKKVTNGFFHWTANTPATEQAMLDPRLLLFRCEPSEPDVQRKIEKETSIDILTQMDIHVLVFDKGGAYYLDGGCAKVTAWMEEQRANSRTKVVLDNEMFTIMTWPP